MKTIGCITYRASALLAALLLPAAVIAEQRTALDPEQHPPSPRTSSPFPEAILPLDTRLSWTRRFNGDETFNEDEVLEWPDGSSATTASMRRMAGESMTHSPGHDMQKSMDAEGVIRQVRKEQGKLKIEHGPITRLGMPAMTMLFSVEAPDLMDGLEKEQLVRFSVDNSSGGFVVTDIAPLDADVGAVSDDGTLDGRGTVKSIRASQGKVKIAHGPIERLGMPAMTMMFKVQDAADLEGLEEGATIDFSVDNSAGGFVITRIKPAS